jgi:DNA-binding NarL/FixJ family response regulator
MSGQVSDPQGGTGMAERIPVYVYATDPISQAGMVAQLRAQAEVRIVEEVDLDSASVALVIADDVDDELTRVIRALQRNGCPRVVAVVTKLDDTGVLAAIEAGACGLLRRSEAVPRRLVAAVKAAAVGDGTVPPDLLGRLLAQVGSLQRQVLAPRGLTFSGLTDREVKVLRLVAEGCDTAEIAHRLSYSERTIKNVIQAVTTRLNLKNRSHAIAYALRQGLI